MHKEETLPQFEQRLHQGHVDFDTMARWYFFSAKQLIALEEVVQSMDSALQLVEKCTLYGPADRVREHINTAQKLHKEYQEMNYDELVGEDDE